MTVMRDNVARSIMVSTATCILPRHGRLRALILTILDVDATRNQLLPDLNRLARSTACRPSQQALNRGDGPWLACVPKRHQ